MQVKNISFKGMPKNYAKIDSYLSRSAQPMAEDFVWLKQQGVTDVLNFRTMVVSGLAFDEKKVVESLGMNYHNIPTITAKPEEQKIKEFLRLVKNVVKNKGKLHLHCAAGADRTGMYSFIYKSIKNIGTVVENEKEWIEKGHNILRYPDLRTFAKSIVQNLKKYRCC